MTSIHTHTHPILTCTFMAESDSINSLARATPPASGETIAIGLSWKVGTISLAKYGTCSTKAWTAQGFFLHCVRGFAVWAISSLKCCISGIILQSLNAQMHHWRQGATHDCPREHGGRILESVRSEGPMKACDQRPQPAT
jgi:hypothetical protein